MAAETRYQLWRCDVPSETRYTWDTFPHFSAANAERRVLAEEFFSYSPDVVFIIYDTLFSTWETGPNISTYIAYSLT